ncbi:MAG: aconitase X catalytic domain-containing protein [Candidatus Bathyarchaeota archaeon]|nr:aconitase X catalytic domain-containing protein [Candidatus Bathyarchaeota archaeon]MDH5793346.1 aconitase X catalytic domain-containing protein [Candidatus Bathyarchaeota archaeon]
MYLTKEEERILAGEFGEGTEKALELLVAIGDAYDAEKMIPISRAHAASSGQEGDLYFVELLANGGARCKVPTSTNPVYDIEYFDKLFDVPKDEGEVARRVMDAYKRVGAILSWSCVPYLAENIPLYGETVAFSESSATPYVNSVIGARTNREAAQSALAAGVIGKAPEYGLLIRENRKGTHLVKVEAILKDEFDYTLLGYYVGKRIGYGIPVLKGISRQPSTEEFINFCAMSNVSGAISMFYMPGFTVEASTVEEAFQGDVPKDKITVTDHELRQACDELQTTSGGIDFVMLGCPHYTLKQLGDVARLLNGKKIHDGVSFWVCTSATAKVLAERNGHVGVIEKAGGHVVVDTCIDEPCWIAYKDKVGITDSPKCAYYRRFKEAMVARLQDCVEAAIRGRWG